MKKLFRFIALFSLVSTVAACSSNLAGTAEDLADDEQFFYGNLIFTPEIRGEEKEARNEVKSGEVFLCVTGSISQSEPCHEFFKYKDWMLFDQRDRNDDGTYRPIDDKDTFALKKKKEGTLFLTKIRITPPRGQLGAIYEYRFKNPVKLVSNARYNYLGTTYLQLEKDSKGIIRPLIRTENDFNKAGSIGRRVYHVPESAHVAITMPDLEHAPYDIHYGAREIFMMPQ